MSAVRVSRGYLIVAAVFVIVAVGIYLVFLRPVSQESTTGTVTSKALVPPGTYDRYVVHANRTTTRTQITTAAAYLFTIDAKDRSEPVRVALSLGEGEGFAVGDQVRITYEVRGVWPFWTRWYVVSMTAAD